MNMERFYRDKVVIITGGSMGIGLEIARQVTRYGGKVVITGRDAARLQRAAAELHPENGNLLTFAGDVADFDANRNLVEQAVGKFGKLDILINNAGISGIGRLEELHPRVPREIITTNIIGTLYMTMAALPELKKTGGSVMIVSSVAGLYGLPGHPLYSLSKMALTSLAQSLRIEAGKHGVFTGIAYVGFTENEEEKRTLGPSGDKIPIPRRSRLVTMTRRETANRMLLQIRQKKHSAVHTVLGKTTGFLSHHLPGLLRIILETRFRKNGNS